MQETEFALESGEWTAVVAPLGASLRGASYRGKPVVTGYMGRENKVGGQGDVLIPFPGRVGGGTYVWDGVRYAMERNDKDGPNAIHGFLRSAQWQAADVQSDQATFAIVLEGAKGYPFALLAAVSYQLSESGLTCELAVTNAGDVDAPVAAGFHPYFTTGSESIDDDELELPFESVLEFENLIPTGKILPCTEADLDFYSPRKIGSTRFNHCFLNPEPDCDGLTTVKLTNLPAGYVSSTGTNGKATGPFEPGSTDFTTATGNNTDHGSQTDTATITSQPVTLGTPGSVNNPDANGFANFNVDFGGLPAAVPWQPRL